MLSQKMEYSRSRAVRLQTENKYAYLPQNAFPLLAMTGDPLRKPLRTPAQQEFLRVRYVGTSFFQGSSTHGAHGEIHEIWTRIGGGLGGLYTAPCDGRPPVSEALGRSCAMRPAPNSCAAMNHYV